MFFARRRRAFAKFSL